MLDRSNYTLVIVILVIKQRTQLSYKSPPLS